VKEKKQGEHLEKEIKLMRDLEKKIDGE